MVMRMGQQLHKSLSLHLWTNNKMYEAPIGRKGEVPGWRGKSRVGGGRAGLGGKVPGWRGKFMNLNVIQEFQFNIFKGRYYNDYNIDKKKVCQIN